MTRALSTLALALLAGVHLGAAPMPDPTPSPTAVVITPERAAAFGLPPVGLALDRAGTVMEVRALPSPGVYLRASGPPGGLMYLQISVLRAPPDQAALDAFVHAELGDLRGFHLGPTATFTIAGTPCQARLAHLDIAGRRDGYLAALLPLPAPSAPAPAPAPPAHAATALIVLAGFELNADEPVTTTALTTDPQVGPLVASLRLVP